MADVQKKEINQSDRKKFWTSDIEAIIAITVVLLILGTINVFSSSFIFAEAEFDTPYFFLKRHVINVFIGLFAFGMCIHFDYHVWRRWIFIILGFTVLALIAVLIVGPVVNGARRWLPLVVVQFQPAELAKLVAIMIAAAYISSKIKLQRKLELLSIQAVIIGFMSLLTELEPDMGTASIIFGIPTLMLMISGLEKRKVLTVFGLGFVGIAALIFKEPYRLERLKITYDPWSDAQNYGYQTVQSLSAIGSGELTGMGLGVGVSKYDYLPEAHTDFAFAIFCQENGFLGAIFSTANKVAQMDTIFPGVSINGVDVGGLTPAEALQKLESSGADPYKDASLTVLFPQDVSLTVTAAELGLDADPAEAVREAYEAQQAD